MEEHHRRLHVKAERASVIGGDIVDGAFGSWALRAARSEHQLKQQSNEDLAQNARISALLGEMRPRMSAIPPNGHQQQYPHLQRRKANTTNIVDVSSQIPAARNAIYGSWQDRHRPSRLYGSQLVSSSSTLPKYDQLYCNTASPVNGNGSTNTIATTGIRREPPEYGKVGRSVSTWQVTNSEHRPSLQAGWLKSSRPLARGALSPAAYFRDLENRNGSGASSPVVGLSVVAVPITQRTVSGAVAVVDEINAQVPMDLENHSTAEVSEKLIQSAAGLSRNTPRQASFMAAMQRHPLKESTSIESNGGVVNEEMIGVTASETEPTSAFTEHESEESLAPEISETPIRRPRNRNSSLRSRQSSRSLGGIDFEKLRLGTARVSDITTSEDTGGNGSSSSSSRKNSRDDGLASHPAPAFSTSSTSSASVSGEPATSAQAAVATTSRQTSSNSSVDSNHNEAMKMIRRARPKSYVLATSASMNDDVLSSSMIANEQSSSISHDTTTSGRELPSSIMGSSTSMEMRSGRGTASSETTTTSNSGPQTSRSLNAPHPPATHRLQRFIALFNSSKTSDGSGEQKKSRMKRSRTSLPASRFALPGTILQRDGVARQTWVKHQEIALGKSGKRNHWEDRWAVLCRRSLYLCIESPAYTSEKTIELSGHTRVDICNAIVDIAYDWLSSTFSKQRHVVRIVTQNRSEHLIELNTESEMLSWISVLQSSSEDGLSAIGGTDENDIETVGGGSNNNKVTSNTAILHNSQSIASLASSSCSTATTSEFLNSQNPLQQINQQQKHQQTVNELSAGVASYLPTSKSFGGLSTTASSTTESAKNRLIMHRYIAKNSQLQSPTANKKMEVDPSTVPSGSSTATTSSFHHHSSQAGTSRESENGEGPITTATTPKSGRKWKKSKAAKQGSGGGSSGSSSGSQQQGTSGAPQPVLGVRLADCPTGNCEDHVPMLVQICVCVVETYGMDTVGIYRIPGNTAAVNALKESLSNRGFDSVDLSRVESLDPRWRDVNVVSSLLKMFLRKLPEPLLTDKLYPFFIDANRISTHHNRLHKLRNLLRKLPRPHYDTLRFLIIHLAEITKHSDVNKMECRNLALMFGPSIVRPSDDNMATMVTHMSDQCKIIETLIHYNVWMFDENSTTEDAVPEQHPADGQNPLEPGGYGVGVPTGVSAASFNDMHNLIRKANEDQAAAMMNEGGKGQKIKNMLRRNSRRDKSKSKLKIESTAPAAVNPRCAWTQPTPSNTSAASVESAFCGNYQERDIDAEIESRQTVSPQMTSGSADGASSTRLDQSPSLESSLGSLPDTSRTEPILGSSGYNHDDEEAKEAARRKRQEEMYSARRIFIAGAAGAAAAATTSADAEKAAIDALANHSQHLHLASSPAFEVLSEETREKIRRMQKKQSWHDTKELRNTGELLKTYSPTKDLTDALSCTSDYSTTSSAPLSTNPPLAVACADQPNSSSDYASSDPSPCARNPSTSPASRPSNLAISPSQLHATSSSTSQTQQPMSRSQKIRLRTKLGSRDPARRHTLSDVDTLKYFRRAGSISWRAGLASENLVQM